MPTPRTVFVPAYAKINLTLNVLGKRPDGYHALASVMQTVSLADTLLIRTGESETVSCDVDVPELRSEQNLALRAAHLLRETAGRPLGADIELRKVVPIQAGLGGGSSDAATALTALSALWDLHLPPGRLEELGAQLGSDVPFLVQGGTALVEGRGEVVTPLPDMRPLWLIVAKPAVNVSTAEIFRALAPADFGHDEDTRAVVSAIRRGADLPVEWLSNTLERVAIERYPEIAAVRSTLEHAGASPVRMSGSGPTLYAPFAHLGQAAEVYGRVAGALPQVWLCHTVTRTQVAASRPERQEFSSR